MRSLGLGSTFVYAFQKLRPRHVAPHPPFVWLTSKHACAPLRCRPGTSDLDVFSQIFAHREYRCLDDITDARFIIDCGANVGYSSAYFLSRFPHARLVAIEPDPGNFAVLEANLAPYGERASAMCTGVWSHPTGLVLDEGPYGDGREWAQTVRVVRAGETALMTATDIGTLLDASGEQRISILKVDIEGAERVVFAKNYESWLPKVDNLVIEIHDAEADAVFRQAVASERFDMSTCDELCVCKRRVTALTRARSASG